MSETNEKRLQQMKEEMDKMSPLAKELVLHILMFQGDHELTSLEMSAPLREVLDAFERILKRMKEGKESDN
jgi:hypothetical protein